MKTDKVVTFEAFAKKAAQKLEEKKKRNTKELYVGALDEEIVIRGLTDQEFIDCSEYSEDAVAVDKYTLYYASKTLQDLAAYMMDKGMIQNHIEVCDMFSAVDRAKLVHEVMKLSGMTGDSTVKEVNELEEVKN